MNPKERPSFCRRESAVAKEISFRLERIFLRDKSGRHPIYGGTETFQNDPNWEGSRPVLRVLPTGIKARAWERATRPAGPAPLQS